MTDFFKSLKWRDRDSFSLTDQTDTLIIQNTAGVVGRYVSLEPDIYLIHEVNDIEFYSCCGDSAYRIICFNKNIWCAGVDFDINTGHIEGLYVEPENRRQGYASKLLSYIMRLTDYQFLEVYGDNHAAIYCYEKFGFNVDVICETLRGTPALISMSRSVE